MSRIFLPITLCRHDQISVSDQPSNRAVAFSASANSYTIVQFFSVIHIQPHEHDLLPACKAGEEALGISAVFHEACTLIQAYCRPVFCHNFQFQLDISRFFCTFDACLCQCPSDAESPVRLIHTDAKFCTMPDLFFASDTVDSGASYNLRKAASCSAV